MPAAVQRNAIAAFRHRFTLRQTRRTVPIMFSIVLVQARGRGLRCIGLVVWGGGGVWILLHEPVREARGSGLCGGTARLRVRAGVPLLCTRAPSIRPPALPQAPAAGRPPVHPDPSD